MTKAENLAENQHVKVCVKNQSATEEDSAFYLTQTMSPNTKFKYEVYDVEPVGENNLPIDSTAMTEQGGYLSVHLIRQVQAKREHSGLIKTTVWKRYI